MQSSVVGPPPSSIPHISVLQAALSKDIVNVSAGRSIFLHERSALSITNGNIIIPPSIQPPGLNQSPVEEPEHVGRSEIETPFTTIVNEITEKNLDIMPSFELPTIEGQNESIEAAIMIQIRRFKMKKHKLKKLRKRRRFIIAKIKLRRAQRKEKLFQTSLLDQIREAEKFSAEEYVTMKLKKAKPPPPWKYSYYYKEEQEALRQQEAKKQLESKP